MVPNWLAVIVAALVPTAVGFVYYNPKVLGTVWMKAAGVSPDSKEGANMAVIFGVSLVLSFMMSMFVNGTFIHQFAIQSLLMNEPGFGDPASELGQWYTGFMEKYGGNFRTFTHGIVHGIITGLFFVLPILGTNAMFERKGWKYIAVNVGYWIITLAIMGGILCAWV